jgi:hypothetical protein
VVVAGAVVVGTAVVDGAATVLVGSGSEAGGRIDNSGRAGPAQDTKARPTAARTPVKPRRTRRCYGRVAEPGLAPPILRHSCV